jgi:hypothetical protein
MEKESSKMKFPLRRLGPVVLLVALVALAPVASSTLVHAEQNAALTNWIGHDAVAAEPSLHNPTFDNGYWYEFHNRYQGSYPAGVWVPAGTNMSDLVQDWRIWFLDGTDVVDCDPDSNYVHSGNKSVKIRSFTWSPVERQVAGLYQVIPDTTPCLTYQFQMHGRSRQKEPDDSLKALRVGIERNGWHPDSANDPAVHGSWPSTTVWGTSHKYTSGYGPLVVTAEALNTQITVLTYADADGGNSHKIHWDTGSFQEVTPSDLVPDPDNPTVNTSGISSGPTVVVGSTSATVNWETWVESSSQVYYRFISGPSTPISPTGTLSHTVYFPFISKSPGPWLSTPLDTTPTGFHSVFISNLPPGSTYEYFVASRGPSGGECVTWISNKSQFTTSATQ